MYLNVAHLLKSSSQNRSKINLLGEIANTNYLFLGLTETHLNENITDIELTIKNFNIVRCDRLARNGGGVCLYINHKARIIPKPSV